jgi:putative ATPase
MLSSEDTETPSRQGQSMPLAARMRPRTFDEFVGQEKILGPDRVLRRTIEHDRLTSIILWGPPGSGKTTLAEIIANVTHAQFVSLSAVSAGVADLRRVVDSARKLTEFNGQRTVLFIDEIHRFNKAQQDAVLPHVEAGTITLIGATTENPSFSVNAALLSRCRVFRLEKLADSDVMQLVRRAISDTANGLGSLDIRFDEDALQRLVRMADGDARVALTALEMAVSVAATDEEGHPIVSIDAVEDAMQRPALLYDRTGDMHYDLISAFIKSVRGSDPDAAVYWLARMVEAGEDALFVTRRLIILAAEDVGLADPNALMLAVACHTAVQSIGMPEGYLPMTECTLYLASAAKSNSAIVTYQAARADVEGHLNEPVPFHLRNAVTSLGRAQGFGQGYHYAHDGQDHYVEQQYLPDNLSGRRYYNPTEQGIEKRIKDRLDSLRNRQL